MQTMRLLHRFLSFFNSCCELLKITSQVGMKHLVQEMLATKLDPSPQHVAATVGQTGIRQRNAVRRKWMQCSGNFLGNTAKSTTLCCFHGNGREL
jgi:hypothetical protein